MLIIAVKMVHGILRTLLLVSVLGDFTARQISVFTGSLLILLISYLTIPWIDAKAKPRLLAIGGMWVALTVLFEIALGRLVMNLSWERFWEDYDITRGGLLGLGRLFMGVAPLIAARIRVRSSSTTQP